MAKSAVPGNTGETKGNYPLSFRTTWFEYFGTFGTMLFEWKVFIPMSPCALSSKGRDYGACDDYVLVNAFRRIRI